MPRGDILDPARDLQGTCNELLNQESRILEIINVRFKILDFDHRST